MTLREKLLLELSKNPNYEGQDATEKALVAELKAEIEAEKAKSSDSEVTAAAKELATQVVDLVKQLTANQLAQTQTVDRKGISPSDKNADPEIAKMSKEEKFAGFVKALINKDGNTAKAISSFGREKALAEGVDVDGGYLVPDEFRADLIQHLLAAGTIRQFATVVPMEGKYLEIPKLTGDVKVYWGTENRAIATTTADFGNMVLTPFRLNAIIYTSRELFDDSAVSIMEVLRKRFTDRVRDEENKVFINGNGTTQPKGIDAETYRTVNAGNALHPDHFVEAYWKLPEAYRGNARWLINSRTMAHVETKKASDGHYLFNDILSKETQEIKGRPTFVTDYVASSKVFFGDVSQYYIGDRQQVTMETTTEGGDTWVKHQVGLKVVERVDGEMSLTTAMVEITNTGVN